MSEVRDYFYAGGLNCAESTLWCLIERGMIDAPPETVRMMSGFGGGMQRGEICGAVTAAVAALGWKLGRTDPAEDRTPSARAVRTFLTRFEEEYGSLKCRELRALHAKEHTLKSPGMYRSCTVFVERAEALVEDILRQASQEAPRESESPAAKDNG